ncbi:uncharacterized protein TNCV_1912581 [Trichonephila clavipes]|nr:uncharacterized protein TNCV_1912581 [Trichonephila clavipes]
MNDMSGSSLFPTETGRVDNGEQGRPREGASQLENENAYFFFVESKELWFQQDGATCHTARATIDLLKDTFGDRLISRFGPVNWPPRSCDLKPLDYFLWGYVKSLVYAYKPQTLDHLEDNIRRVIADIRSQILETVIENWTSRLDYIRASRGKSGTLPKKLGHPCARDKPWDPHIVCQKCVVCLRLWSSGKRDAVMFETPMIWREPQKHHDDCYFCVVKTNGINPGNRNKWSYPLSSAQRPQLKSREVQTSTSKSSNDANPCDLERNT